MCRPPCRHLLLPLRRSFCKDSASKPPEKVPKGFDNFFKHKPRSAEKGPEAAGKASGSKAEGSSSGGRNEGGSSGSDLGSRSGGGPGSGSGSSTGSGASSGGSGGFNFGGDGGGSSAVTLALGLTAGVVLAMQLLPSRQEAQEITFADFRRELLEAGSVDRIVIVNKNKARVYTRTTTGPPGARVATSSAEAQYWFSLSTVNGFEKKMEQAQADIGVAPRDYLPVTYETETFLSTELLKIAPTLLLIGFWLLMMRGAGGMGGMMGGGGGGGRNIFQVGKSKPTVITKEMKTGVTFKDVAGLAEAKVEVMELVDFLKNPKRYVDLGAKIPRGALLVGPPGTGKTLLAKATAGEANVPFLSVSGADFIEMFVGVGPSRVRDLFAQAKTMQPCIIWIDEIDAVGRARGRGGMVGGNDERENTLNQLLVEMDGFMTTGQIVVLAGTNRPDTLDQALLRPGRFDRTIEVGSPDISGRAEIFRVHLAGLRLTSAFSIHELSEKLASLTPGFSGAEIANVCNEAALTAARTQKDAVELDDFHSAMDRVIGGLEQRSKVLTVEEKERVAHHEAGHAVTGWFLQHAAPLLKVSIVPRGMAALGYAQYVPKERKLHTKEQMLDTMCMMLGGLIAEKIFYGRASTGPQDDLRKVTRMAYSIVTLYGMNTRVGNLSFPPKGEGQIDSQRPFSERTAEIVDDEVRALVNGAYERTVALLTEKKDLMAQLARLLLKKEVIHREDVVSVLGERQWKEATSYNELAAGVGNSMPEEVAPAATMGGSASTSGSASSGGALSPRDAAVQMLDDRSGNVR